MWASAFGVVNIMALLGWLALILVPRGRLIDSLVLYLGVTLLCLVYAVLLGLLLTGLVDGGGTGAGGAGFTSIEGIRAIFATDGGVVVGWTHYLAFDLFTGLWIAKDAQAKEISRIVQTPVLLLTLVAGPAGLLVWMLLREKSARLAARASGNR